MNSDVLVSICCITYNHAPYIRQCLDGFIMQKTNFKFEILIHDDASTDGTADIIREYEAKYPNIFKPIYQTENQYSKGKNISATYNWPRAIGKYIAQCEGDDYWTDPLKLQKQVDYLEAHPDCFLCFTNADVISDREEERNMYNHLEERDYSAIELYKKWSIPTTTVMWRNILNYPIETFKDVYFGDIFLFLNLAVRGKVHCINQKTGVYRRNEGGVSFQMNLSKAKRLIKQYLFMTQHFAEYSDLVEYSKYCVQVYCWYIMYESDASIREKFSYLRLERKMKKAKIFTKSTIFYCLNTIKKAIFRQK